MRTMLMLLLLAPVHDDDRLRELADAAFQGNVAAIREARDHFAIAADDETREMAARRFYFMALADWLESQGSADSRAGVAAAQRAAKNIDRAIELDPGFVPSYVVRNRVAYQLFSQGGIDIKEGSRWMRETYVRAKELAPGHPLVQLIEGAIRYYAPPANREAGKALVLEAIEGLEARQDDAHFAIWLPIAWNWYGSMYLGEGDFENARSAFENALKVRPDYAWIRTAMLPMTEVVDPGPRPQISGRWRRLLTDGEGDQRIPNLPDLGSVSWQRSAEMVWFRLDLKNELDPTRFGVNLALDVDSDQSNGNAWWAGNRGFKYDRLVSVWVAQGCDGTYRGTAGVATAAEVQAGRRATSAPGAVRFATGENAILVGVPQRLLGDLERLRVVVTVGSHSDWSDVAPEEGFVGFASE